MSSAHALVVLDLDSDESAVAKRGSWRRYTRPQDVRVEFLRRLLIFVDSRRLSDVAAIAREAHKANKLGGVVVRNDVPSIDRLLAEIDDAHLRTLRNVIVHSNSLVPRRILSAWSHGAERDLVADAVADDATLYVRDCALERIDVPRQRLDVLNDLSTEQFKEFEISAGGEFIHWPANDVHLDAEALRALVDPELALRLRSERILETANLGAAIRKVRMAMGLTQGSIEGLSEREVRRLESGYSVPRMQSIQKLAESHGLSVAHYLDRVAAELHRSRSKSGGARGPMNKPAGRLTNC